MQHQQAGAVFHRCALQVNPHHYRGTFRGENSDGDAQSYAEGMVRKAVEIGVAALAITDHNNAKGVAAFQRAAADYDITIFPGFELFSKDGIHVLCIYPPETSEDEIGRSLGHFGIRGLEPSADLSNKDFVEIINDVQGQGGIAVAAHVTNDNGLFKVSSGQPRVQAWRNENLLAIQIPGSVDDLEHNVRQIVQNKNAEYRRSRIVAAINAKDITNSADLDKPSATCWIKMSEVSVDGLRQAFLDPESRIRLNSDPEPEEHAELISLAWEGGFLDGTTVRFNPNLNVLVGGRGAGKSTIIESLRYVLDLEPIGEEARKAHLGMVNNVLRGGTKISLRLRSHRPATSEYLIERIVNNPPVVRDGNGQISNLLPADVLPRVEVYGQHEISELTRSSEKLTKLLNRFINRDDELALLKREDSVRRNLEQTRRSILEVKAEREQTEDRLAALPGLEETLNRYQQAGLEERLGEQSLLVKEERVIDSIPERLQPFHDGLALIRQELPIDRTFLSPAALEGLPGKETLADANGVIAKLSDDLEGIAQQIAEALKRADKGINEIRGRWDSRKNEVEDAYHKILRELQRAAVDGEEFIRLRREIENLRPLRERSILLDGQEKEIAERRRSLLAEWEDIKAAKFRLLNSAARRVSSRLKDRVQVEVRSGRNRDQLADLLRSQIGGRLSEAIEKIRQMPDFSLPVFVGNCREGAEVVREAYGIPSGQAAALAGASADVLMEIEELELLPTTTISLNVAPDGDTPSWQELDKLSTGQKSTAVLMLLLLESDAPLVVDQPEDDLDNRFITAGIVPKMREEKRRRQFIFSSHNANIPVLGDAELILGLTASGAGEEGGRARIADEHVGSIDAASVRELVGQILEGGKEAFETRRLKYGF